MGPSVIVRLRFKVWSGFLNHGERHQKIDIQRLCVDPFRSLHAQSGSQKLVKRSGSFRRSVARDRERILKYQQVLHKAMILEPVCQNTCSLYYWTENRGRRGGRLA